MTDFSKPSAMIDRLNDMSVTISEILDESADVLLAEIRKTAPKKTGKYAKSWKKDNSTENSIQITTPMGNLYIILEFQGRRSGRISARRNVLHFQVDGQDVFAKFVDHPGFPPIPHVRPALKRVTPKIREIIHQKLQELL